MIDVKVDEISIAPDSGDDDDSTFLGTNESVMSSITNKLEGLLGLGTLQRFQP